MLQMHGCASVCDMESLVVEVPVVALLQGKSQPLACCRVMIALCHISSVLGFLSLLFFVTKIGIELLEARFLVKK